eukprot:gene12755-8695_t
MTNEGPANTPGTRNNNNNNSDSVAIKLNKNTVKTENKNISLSLSVCRLGQVMTMAKMMRRLFFAFRIFGIPATCQICGLTNYECGPAARFVVMVDSEREREKRDVMVYEIFKIANIYIYIYILAITGLARRYFHVRLFKNIYIYIYLSIFIYIYLFLPCTFESLSAPQAQEAARRPNPTSCDGTFECT